MIDALGATTGPSMSTSSPARRRTRRPSSRLSGRNPPPKRSRMSAIRFSLLVTAACGTTATGAYFAFLDDLFTRLISHQTQAQISYEDQIADLRAQMDRVSRLDQERVEQQIKPLLQRQATLEEVTSGLTKELSIQARNSSPPSGTISTGPLLLLDREDRLLDESDQPASKGYIMYANSPMHWTPVALPDEISAAA